MGESMFDEAAATADEGATQAETPAGDTAAGAQKQGAEEKETPWWERAAAGKWATEEEALAGRAFETLGKRYADSSREAHKLREQAEAAQKAQEEINERWKTVEGVIGAPVGEDGQPVDYAVQLPEGAEFEPELMGKLTDFARERNLSQKVLQDAIDQIVLPWQIALSDGQVEAELEYVEKMFDGDKEATKKAIKGFYQSASAILDPMGEEAIRDLRTAGGVGAAVRTMLRLHEASSRATIGQGLSSAAGAIGKSEYLEIIKDKDWARDSDKLARVVEHLNRTTPDDNAG